MSGKQWAAFAVAGVIALGAYGGWQDSRAASHTSSAEPYWYSDVCRELGEMVTAARLQDQATFNRGYDRLDDTYATHEIAAAAAQSCPWYSPFAKDYRDAVEGFGEASTPRDLGPLPDWLGGDQPEPDQGEKHDDGGSRYYEEPDDPEYDDPGRW